MKKSDHKFQKTKLLALVLSGGASKGFAHIGVLRQLEKNGIKPDLIVGTSMGALVGGLYAVGKSVEELEEMALKFNSIGSFSLISTLFKGNILNINKVKRILKNSFGDKTHEDCVIPFIAVATELNTGKQKNFSTGLIRESIMASISIPCIFPRMKIGDNYYVDGGLVNNLPEDVARDVMPEAVLISVDVVGEYEKQIDKSKSVLLQTIVNSIALITQTNVKNKPVLADMRIVLTQPNVSQLDFSAVNTMRAIRKGEAVTKAKMNEIKSLLSEDDNELST